MGDNQQLLNLLSLPNVLLDPSKQEQAVSQLCLLMNTDWDTAQIVQPSIKLLSSHQPLTRIVVMTLVQRHVGRNPDIMPQATNALLKCAVDPNPAVRRAAVTTLACMPDSADISLPVVAAALRDPHSSVQGAAAVACRVLPKTNPLSHIDHVDELYRLIRSEDPMLVHACLTSLDVILATEGGVVINRAMVRHLSSRSRSLPDAVLVDVLRLLARYQPGSDEERLALMNRLDWLLTSPAPHLIEAALRLFFHLCSGRLSHLRADVVSRAAGALCGPGDCPPELRWAVLELVRRLGPEHHACFCHHYRYFVPRPQDGAALSERLVQFLWRVAGTGSAAAVVRELVPCLSSERLRGAAVRSLLRVGRRQPQLSSAIVEPLCRLARGGGGGAALVAGALTAADLAPLPPSARLRLLSALLTADLATLPPPPLCRLLAALGRWGAALPTVPARLRQLAHRGEPGAAGYCGGGGGGGGGGEGGETGGESSLADPAVRRTLLETTARLFVLRPAELQLTLGLLLERAAAHGGELAAAAARLYAALELTGGRELLDGAETEETHRHGEQRVERDGEGTAVGRDGQETEVDRDGEDNEQNFLSVSAASS